MPDAAGRFKGQGWSKKRAEGWDRAFGYKVRIAAMCADCEDPEGCYAWGCYRERELPDA